MAGRAHPFRPSSDQETFRAMARTAWDDPEHPARWVADWCRLTMKNGWDRPVTAAVWRAWEATPGFLDWWEDVFPEMLTPGAVDTALLERRFMNGLGRGLDVGDGAAMRSYIELKKLRAIGSALADPALDAYVNGPFKDSWSGGGVVGEAK